MVHVPTRGEVPVRLGPAVRQIPDYGPSKMSRDVYSDPVRFELERERVLNRSWLLAGRSEQAEGAGDWITYEGHGESVVVTRQPDGSLAALQATLQQQTGDRAEVRLRYTLAGRQIDTVIALERHDGRWYPSDGLRRAETAARQPAPPR